MTFAHRPTRVLTALATAGALTLGLAACGDDTDAASSSSSSSSSSSGSQTSSSSGASKAVTDGSIDDVTVKDVKDKAPEVSVKTPFGVGEFASKVLTEGSGAASTDKSVTVVDYVLLNGTTGKVVDETYTKKEVGFDLADTTLIGGLRKSLMGIKKGERRVTAMPPAEAFGDQGNPQIGVAGTDTLVFLIDAVDIVSALPKAEGTEVPAKAGLPKATWNDGKAASFEMPKADPPKELVVQPLIEGKGAEVTKGDTAVVTYTGALWRDGKVFDSSFNRNANFSFPVGGGQVIAGWDKGVEGQKVGSRLLLVVPPAEGYGKEGSGEIKGTDTIVFVVDILAAY